VCLCLCLCVHSLGRSKGFCFIDFSDPASAQAALASMNGFNLMGRAIKVTRGLLRRDPGTGLGLRKCGGGVLWRKAGYVFV
jgi:hypothetical protein